MLVLVTDIVVTVSLAVALVEAGLGGRRPWPAVAGTVGGSLARNPLVVATLAGAGLSVTALRLPAPFQAPGDLLGAAALPCTLFALGASLVGRLAAASTPQVLLLAGLKLVGHPLAVWAAAGPLGLDPFWLRVAVIEASLPTAATVFVLAQRYERAVETTSSAVLLSTLLSVVTVSVLLALSSG